ncbi:MAG: proline dehydrogenase family protein, partial [Acidimicrobiia bacterium]|nr:proline dehydrogenase family protein [Acidimicrobiia bacterium]
MMRSAVLAVTDRGFTKRMITDTRAGRALVTRFVAGSELSDAVDVAKTLNHHGLLVSLDYLGEHITDITEADRAVEAYVACARAIAAEGLDANISIKLTQLGMGLDDDVAAGHLDTIATAAAEAATTVTVDMEESTHTAVTIDLYEDAQRRHGNLGIAIQAYLRRSPSDIERLGTLGGHI